MSYVGDLMQEEPPGWFDRMLRGIELSALFIWFMLRRFRGLKARRWVEGWIRGHYLDVELRSWIAICARAGRRFAWRLMVIMCWLACRGMRKCCGHNLTDRQEIEQDVRRRRESPPCFLFGTGIAYEGPGQGTS